MKVLVLGRGRLGQTLLRLLPGPDLEVAAWGRGEPFPTADVAWICVSDRAVAEVAAALPPGPVVLHAAGSLGPDVLRPHAERAVCHPLMTFPGPAVGVPSLVGAGAAVDGTPGAVALARALATRLGMVPFEVPGDRRLYHAAACLGSGHLGAAFLDAVAVMQRAGVADPAARLLPLALESLRRAGEEGPMALTGPVARGDHATAQAHLDALGSAEERETYEALAARIVQLRVRGSDPRG